MGFSDKIAQYRAWRRGVVHCTFNPGGPGVVRIHLLPPKFRLFGSAPYLAILNGYYILPVGSSAALLLSYFIDEVSATVGTDESNSEITELMLERAVKRAAKVYPAVDRSYLKNDLLDMLDVITSVARGEGTDVEIEKLSVRNYQKLMYAPHRMDLMVSAMTDECGKWKCNQHCIFCYAKGQSFSGVAEMTTQQWCAAIDKLRAAGVPMLTFTGGEPTEREDIVELVGYAKWFVTRLNTNGINVTSELASALREASLDSMQITFYSSDKNIHNTLVGGDHYDATVAGIKNAVAAGLDVSVNTPLCKLNRDYGKTLMMLHSLGVRFVTLSGLISAGAATDKSESYDLCEDELYAIVKEAKALCDELGMEMDFTSPGLISYERLEKIGLNVPSCGAALSNMAIAPDGTVVPCQSWLGADASLGNILEDKFSDIWNSSLARKLRGMSSSEALSCPFRAVKGGDSRD